MGELELREIVYQKIPPSTCTNKDWEPKKHLQFQNLAKEAIQIIDLVRKLQEENTKFNSPMVNKLL